MNEQRFVRVAFLAWAVFALVLAVLLVRHPQHSLVPLYGQASREFWAGVIPAREYLAGFYYLPACQILFTPVALTGAAGGVLAQLISVAFMTWAAWELARLLVPQRTILAFAIVLLLIIPGVAGILRIVQLDAVMWALTALAAGAIARRRPTAAAIILAVAFAFKPTAIAAVMLMGVVWPRVGLRLLPLVLFVLVLPFLCAHWHYILRLYASLFDRVGGAIQQPRNWMDFGNMLIRGFGLPVPFAVMLGIRALMSPATVGITWLARKNLDLPFAAFLAFAFAALYLLLFNPRTEGGGYAGLSLVAAPLAARMFLVERKPIGALLLASVCLALGLSSLTRAEMNFLGVWFKPMLGILVTVLVLIPRALNPWLFLPANEK